MLAKMNKTNTFIIAATFISAGFVVLLFSLICNYTVEINVSQNLIIIDFGSLKKSAFIYNYGTINLLSRPKLLGIVQCAEESYEPTTVLSIKEDMLEDCLDQIFSRKLKGTLVKDVTLIIVEKPGTRVSCREDDPECNNFKSRMTNFLNNTPYSGMNVIVEPISGFDIAQYNWLAVNQHFHNLQNKDQSSPNYYGSVDLGTNSLEIAYVPIQKLESLDNSTQQYTNISIDDSQFGVLTSTLACAGADQARYLFDLFLFYKTKLENKNNLVKNLILDPCKMDKLYYSLKYSDIKSAPCNYYASDIIKIFKSNNKNLSSAYRVVGRSDLNKCFNYMEEFFGSKNNTNCNNDPNISKPCLFSNIQHLAGKHTKFAVTSLYSYFIMDLKLNKLKTITLKQYYDAMVKECYTEKLVVDFDGRDCFHITYGYYLLKYGLGLDDNSTAIYNNVAKTDLGWMTGAAVVAKSTANLDPNSTIMFHNIMLGITIPAIILFIIGIGLLIKQVMEIRSRGSPSTIKKIISNISSFRTGRQFNYGSFYSKQNTSTKRGEVVSNKKFTIYSLKSKIVNFIGLKKVTKHTEADLDSSDSNSNGQEQLGNDQYSNHSRINNFGYNISKSVNYDNKNSPVDDNLNNNKPINHGYKVVYNDRTYNESELVGEDEAYDEYELVYDDDEN